MSSLHFRQICEEFRHSLLPRGAYLPGTPRSRALKQCQILNKFRPNKLSEFEKQKGEGVALSLIPAPLYRDDCPTLTYQDPSLPQSYSKSLIIRITRTTWRPMSAWRNRKVCLGHLWFFCWLWQLDQLRILVCLWLSWQLKSVYDSTDLADRHRLQKSTRHCLYMTALIWLEVQGTVCVLQSRGREE